MGIHLADFTNIRPRFLVEQEKSLEWIAEAHTRAEAKHTGGFYNPLFYQEIKERLWKIGFGKDKIATRGVQIEDLCHGDWSNMVVYPVDVAPYGVSFRQRSAVYEQESVEIFETFYPEGSSFPDHLIHVTCTGYVAPSPAQRVVSKRGKGEQTVVTHAYHMGCYASIPAIRISSGYLSLSSPSPSQIDIVHTELCSLHMSPLKHSIEQLIVQSLFADGFIKYSVYQEADLPPVPSFHILALHEETIPHSSHSMTWCCEDHSLGMSLAKEVPALIASALPDYLDRLFAKAHISREVPAVYAVHPGGPKILLQVQKLLHLDKEQLDHSYTILKTCGNMSSATLPHIWQLMLSDPQISDRSYVVSLAFGPGLSISGALFKKRGS